MLGKMLIHGLIAATIVGSAAAVYAQTRDIGILTSAGNQAAIVSNKTGAGVEAKPSNGYLQPDRRSFRGSNEIGESNHHRGLRSNGDD